MSTVAPDDGGAISATIRAAIARNTSAADAVAVDRDRSARVAGGGDRRFEGDLTEQRGADRVGERPTAARTEELVDDAVAGREAAHVLDHADDAQEAAPCHVGRPLGDLLGGERRRGDDHEVGAGEQPSEPHLDVAGARRHVDEEVVELSPVHVAQELLDRLGEHQPAPHQGRLLADEEAGRHDLERAGAHPALVRDDLGLVRPVDPLGLHPIGDPEQPRHREAPNVGIEHADDVAGGRRARRPG